MAIPFMNCQFKRLINGSDGETGTDFATVNQAGLLGWNLTNDTWAYASATTITVPTDATTRYAVGDKVRLKQGGGYKYFYITAVAATTLTVNGGSDYSVANSAITDIATSKMPNPFGFPGWFNYSPTYTGFSVNPSNVVARFSLTGRVCHVAVRMGTAGTSNTTGFSMTAPITAATVTNHYWGAALWAHVDNGAQAANPGVVYIASAGTVFTLDTNGSGGAWTNANGKRADFQIFYEV